MSDIRLIYRLRLTAGMTLLGFGGGVFMGWFFWIILTLPADQVKVRSLAGGKWRTS